jgi:2-isopropylmalate synthase
MHVAGVNADPATFEHIDPAAVGNTREVLISELSGKGTVVSRAHATGVELDDAAAARVIERVKALEHRGFQFEAADGSFDLLIRRETGEHEPAVPPGVLARDRREARGRQGPDRGDDQDLGRRRALRPHRGGQRPGQRAGPRAARGDRRAHPHIRDIRLVNYKVRILDEFKATGAVTRVLLDASDGTDSGARSACTRTSSRRPGTRWWTRSKPGCCPAGAATRAPPRAAAAS